MNACTWKEFATQAPQLAAFGKRLLMGESDVAIAMMATVAPDGTPHMAPVCPIFAGDDLFLSAGRQTPKVADLRNDGRFVLHAFLGDNDEEFQIAGRAAVVTDPAEIAAVHAAIRFAFQPDDPVFCLGLERCLWGYWEKVGQPGTYPVRKRWRAGQSGA